MKGLEYFQLKQEVEDFLYAEAELLDARQFKDWLDLLADDLVYFMPMRRNVKFGQHAAEENTRQDRDISWFDEDKWTLSKRIEQIMTGVHWAEEPLSRVCHTVSNIQILDARPSVAAPDQVSVRSRFIVYQNRLEDETNFFVGKRTDMLRKGREAGSSPSAKLFWIRTCCCPRTSRYCFDALDPAFAAERQDQAEEG